MRTRLAPVLTAAALLAALTACGGGDGTSTGESAAPTAAGASSAPAPAAGGGTVLLASVGNAEDPEAFDIALTTEDGQDVTSLPAGPYEIRVTDPSEIHNFALTGEGVDEATSVPDTDNVVWNVQLAAGDYEYVCDPHVGSMNGEFTVT